MEVLCAVLASLLFAAGDGGETILSTLLSRIRVFKSRYAVVRKDFPHTNGKSIERITASQYRSTYITPSTDLSPCLAGQSTLPPLVPGYVYVTAIPPPTSHLKPIPPFLPCVLLGIKCSSPPSTATPPVLNPPPPLPPSPEVVQVLQLPTPPILSGTGATPCYFLGEQQPCTCSAGVQGIHICLATGIYGPCSCAGGRMIGPDVVM